ncbi:chlorite dismutase family protein [Limnobacter parvus]|uniref:Chlorite dismutase family protein n=1 Tax=Limnobacter parvus TaxID=2939690 RepID=A0ABT1XMV3_9BURK|nr:chlorite dismutase family protein [Limnobacter parvus]MCR2747439.1 chlorite dismutase family protein [Limnobacter parvus]
MNNHYSFIGGFEGQWQVNRCEAVIGEPIEPVQKLNVVNAPASQLTQRGTWVLQGFTSNVRYAERHEIAQLRARQEGLNRPTSTCAALIPIKKSPEWWALSQDERRAIFEAQSHHTEIGLAYLPEIARQLHHSRDLGEPFDFLTWFEFAPEHTAAFDELLVKLRASEEWKYVEREIDIRLVKNN